jgi:hypothetical protein
MLSIRRTLVVAVFTAALAPIAATARADVNASVTTTRGQENVTYQFSDELLDGGGIDGTATRIVINTHRLRQTLIRPRTAFVMEMFKSVEAL